MTSGGRERPDETFEERLRRLRETHPPSSLPAPPPNAPAPPRPWMDREDDLDEGGEKT